MVLDVAVVSAPVVYHLTGFVLYVNVSKRLRCVSRKELHLPSAARIDEMSGCAIVALFTNRRSIVA